MLSTPRQWQLHPRAVSLVVASLCAIALACSDNEAPTSTAATAAAQAGGVAAAFPRTITDSSGAAVTIAAQPQRIVSLSPGATEILYAIGAGARVIATDRFSDYPAAAKALPKLEYSQPSAEAAVALAPQLVIMTTRQREQVQQFRDLKLTVLYIEEGESIDAVYRTITLFGEITGETPAAAQLVSSMRARIERVTAAVADVRQGPRVFYELSADLYTVAPATFIGGMLSALKAQNVAAGATSPFPQLTAEAVLGADPEVVILSDAAYGESLQTVGARPGWAAVSAVKNRRVYPIDADIVNRPGPRIAEGMEALARALYPERVR